MNDLNTSGFNEASGWRLPTLAELQTILADFPCTHAGGSPTCLCTSTPCIAFSDANTQSGYYWSATSYVPTPYLAWHVYFNDGFVGSDFKTTSTGINYARAVRGGL